MRPRCNGSAPRCEARLSQAGIPLPPRLRNPVNNGLNLVCVLAILGAVVSFMHGSRVSFCGVGIRSAEEKHVE